MRRGLTTAIDKKKEIEKIYHKLNLKNWEGWYEVSCKQAFNVGARNFLERNYQGSLVKALFDLYPDYEWNLLRFKRLPQGFFQELENRKVFFEHLRKALNISTPEQWYSVNNAKIIENGGAYMLNSYYKGAIEKMLAELQPELSNYNFFRTKSAPKFLHKLENQREYVKQIANQMGIKQEEEWYGVSVTYLLRNFKGFSTIFRYYNRSIFELLKAIFPNFPWQIDRFHRKHQSYWRSEANQRLFLERYMIDRQMESLDGFYRVRNEEIAAAGGSGLLRRYRGSLFSALRSLFPSHPWHPLSKPSSPKLSFYLPSLFPPEGGREANGGKEGEEGRGDERGEEGRGERREGERRENTRRMVAEVQRRMGIKRKEEWYRVSKADIRSISRYSTNQTNFLYLLLSHFHPDQHWEIDLFRDRGKKSNQRSVYLTIQSIFPNHPIIEDYQFPCLVFPDSNIPIEIDLFLPSLLLAVEYNGEQHYNEFSSGFNCFESYLRRDLFKSLLLSRFHFSYLVIPYWWNRSPSSLFPSLFRSLSFLRSK